MTRGRLPGIVVACGLVAAVVGAFVLEPWKLFVDQRVDEAVSPAPAGAAAAQPVVLARGVLISHEHRSSGSVVVRRLPDGSQVL